MTTMWTRPKSADDVILSKLVQLARGDVGLVNEAIRSIKRDNQPIPIKPVMDYITQRLSERESNIRASA